jgi:hypothetical protein
MNDRHPPSRVQISPHRRIRVSNEAKLAFTRWYKALDASNDPTDPEVVALMWKNPRCS